MTDPDRTEPIPETPEAPTPGEIEAALSDLRAQMSAPDGAPPAAPAAVALPPASAPVPARGPGWGGTAALMLAAALLGGGAAGFLPGYLGLAPAGDAETGRRIGLLETRVGQIATGQSGTAATQSFADLRAHLDGLEVRLRALEQASARPEGEADLVALKAVETALGQLADRVVALESRLGQLAEQTAAPPPERSSEPSPETADAIASLRRDLDELERRFGTLEDIAPAGEVIASLDGRVSAIESADPGRASRQAALALIVARIGDAVAAGRPFTAELAALKAAAPALDTTPFTAYAARGLPTVATLADRLRALDRPIRDGADFDRGGDWLDRAWRGFGRLVTVRRDGLADGTEPEDHLARALYHAGRGDLAYAYAEIDRLSGAARGAAATWLAEANARLTLDAALDELTRTILADLARPAP